MREKWRLRGTLTLSCIAVVSCSPIPPQGSERITHIVQERTGHSLVCESEEHEVEKATQALLSSPHTLETAIKISLLNNHDIQALLDEVGISQMTLVEAGLFQNPLFVANVGFPLSSSSSTISNEISLSQNIIDLFSVPLRKKHASTKLEQTEVEVADAILQHIQEVKRAYRTVQYQTALCDFYALYEGVAEAAQELAKAQKEAGNINEAAYVTFQVESYQAAQQKKEAKIALIGAQEKLNMLMGLYTVPLHYFTPTALPALPKDCMPPEDLKIVALENRLDLRALRLEAKAIAQSIGLESWWAKTDTRIGAISAKDSEGISSIGPSLGFQIPLFDTGVAGREKIRRRLHQACQKIVARQMAICTEIEAVRALLRTSYELAHFQENVLVPLSENELFLSGKLYNTMTISSFELLQKKQASLINKQAALKARYDFWNAVLQLENSLGKIILVE